jgi:hypothetical protein
MALINTTTTGILGSTFAADGTGSLTVQQNGVTLGVYGNIPAFSAYSSAQSSAITSATDTKVLFDIETFDTNNNFASSRFTPTIAGYYQINASVRFNGTFSQAGLILFKNGSNAGYLENGTGNIVTGSSLQYMNGSTDYLEIYVNVTGTSLSVGNSNVNTNYFSGILVKAA